MPSEKLRVYWDSCAYISCIQNTPGRGAVLRQIMSLASAGDIVFVASALVIAEVTKINDPSISAQAEAKLIREFFENPYIQVRSVDRLIAEEAREISREFGLKPPDAIHVATALKYKCAYLQTYDGENGDPTKLLAFNGRIGMPALRIEVPQIPPQQQQMFAPP